MRSWMCGMLAAGAALLAGCGGSSGSFANRARPPVPVNLSVEIDATNVSVSPDSVGAGPVQFIVTNQAPQTESLRIQDPGGSQLADTGPINPQATAQVTVDFRQPGAYKVLTSRSGSQAAQAGAGAIQAATLRIGRMRPNANNQLLQP